MCVRDLTCIHLGISHPSCRHCTVNWFQPSTLISKVKHHIKWTNGKYPSCTCHGLISTSILKQVDGVETACDVTGRREINENKPGNDLWLQGWILWRLASEEDDRRKECRVKGVAPTSKPVRISTPIPHDMSIPCGWWMP